MRVWKTLLVCCLSFIIFLSLGVTTGFAEGEQDTAATQSTIEEPERLFEVTESRTKNSKTYQLSDGTFEWVGYTEDIHYEDADGKLKEINNAINDKPAKEDMLTAIQQTRGMHILRTVYAKRMRLF